MEAWRNPTSPAAWGKAAMDIGLIGLSAAKIGNAAGLGRVGRIGEELTAFGKTSELAKNALKYSSESTKQAADLSKHFGYMEKYEQAGFKHLENGHVRYYGQLQPANKIGEMAGRRYIHEFNPITGRSRGWHETLDHNFNIWQVRPELNSGIKKHYRFDSNGNYLESW